MTSGRAVTQRVDFSQRSARETQDSSFSINLFSWQRHLAAPLDFIIASSLKQLIQRLPSKLFRTSVVNWHLLNSY